MRTVIRGLCLGAALVLGGAALSACQRQSEAPAEAPAAPSDAEREAAIAAEQLAALGGPASAEQRAAYAGDFQASGGLDALSMGEGAWELRLLEDYAQFSRPGLGEDGGIPGERDYRERGMRVVAGAVTITIMQQPCTASGLQLPYVAHVLYEGVAYQGCARRGINEGEGGGWAAVLPDLIPAIDTCIARAEAQPARVTFATPLGEGETAVRLREANGSRRECIAAGGQVTVYETLSDVDSRRSEGDPEFQRGGARPAGACVEPAVSGSGAQLGWLIRRSC
ncbi:MAG TPA: hypothetical protein VEA80_03555 [Vitreimonas sp.]|uniref:hypothetical protein n=1 Tax=Vitreimonas sp. TaxID=3069702 RepID=UPI002D374030|nr:hypothetical protein [Vitreimonas sp.]HYD86525.1 hypothetical protein [Vitreimonas sp.]